MLLSSSCSTFVHYTYVGSWYYLHLNVHCHHVREESSPNRSCETHPMYFYAQRIKINNYYLSTTKVNFYLPGFIYIIILFFSPRINYSVGDYYYYFFFNNIPGKNFSVNNFPEWFCDGVYIIRWTEKSGVYVRPVRTDEKKRVFHPEIMDRKKFFFFFWKCSKYFIFASFK